MIVVAIIVSVASYFLLIWLLSGGLSWFIAAISILTGNKDIAHDANLCEPEEERRLREYYEWEAQKWK